MGRLDILKEILETERVYCTHLRTLEDYYDKPLAQQRKMMDAQCHMKVFKDLNVIRALNENLLYVLL